jgi:hypothetical protein
MEEPGSHARTLRARITKAGLITSGPRKAPLILSSLSTGKEGLHPHTSPAVPARPHSMRKRWRLRIASQFRRPPHKSVFESG